MAAKALRLILSPVVDWPATRAWYRDVLGLAETGGWDSGKGNRGSFLRVGSGEIELLEMPMASFTPLLEICWRWHSSASTRYQLERLGSFCADTDAAPEKPVYHRTVSLRDTWATIEKASRTSGSQSRSGERKSDVHSRRA
jgi:hypothetical protein